MLGSHHAAFAARAVYTALSGLVPLNVLLALLLPERGIRYLHSYRWRLLGRAEDRDAAARIFEQLGAAPLRALADRD